MEVVVIGAGIVGVTAALTLAEAGARVTVVERGRVAGEASGLNAGVIGGGGWGDRPGVDVALKMGSLDRFRELAEERHHDVGFDDTGTLTLIRTEQEWDWAAATVAADRHAGRSLELIEIDELVRWEPSIDPSLRGAIVDPVAARAEPVAAVEAFAAEAEAAGAVFELGHAVDGLRTTTGGGWEVSASASPGGARARIGADAVVVAAGPWCAQVGALVGIEIPIVAVRGQMWASSPRPPLLRHAIAAAESPLAWSSDDPGPDRSDDVEPPELTHRDGHRRTRHLYGRQRPNGELVFGGDRVWTTDRTVDATGIAVNHAHVAELLPAVGDLPPVRTWAGLMPFSSDGRPLVGPVPGVDGLFLAGGLASSGFGRGPMTGQLVADLVLGRDPGYDLGLVSLDGRVGPGGE